MQQFHGSDEYIASDELIRSVNIAAALKKPLLVKGEPGTGNRKDHAGRGSGKEPSYGTAYLEH